MRILALMVIGLMVVGCGKKQSTNTNEGSSTPAKPRKLTAEEEKVVGTYEIKKDGFTNKLFLQENGIVAHYLGGLEQKGGAKWSIANGEIHTIGKDGSFGVLRINKDRSITFIAEIEKDGKRTDIPKDEQLTLKKIK